MPYPYIHSAARGRWRQWPYNACMRLPRTATWSCLSLCAWWAAGLCLAGLGQGIAHAEDDLGRLFTTPQERRLLDQARRSASQQASGAAAESATLSYNGHVLRSLGPPQIWVNGEPVRDEARARQLGVGLQPDGKGLPVLLQPVPAPQGPVAAAGYELPETLRRVLQNDSWPGSGYPPPGVVWLQPGQTLNRHDGRIVENYQRPASTGTAAAAAGGTTAPPADAAATPARAPAP